MMDEKNKRDQTLISRRNFVKGAAFGTLGLALGMKKSAKGFQAAQKSVLFSSQNPASKVVLIRSDEAVDAEHNINAKVVQEMVDTAVKTFAGENDILKAWGRFIKLEDMVGVKFTRCGWMRVHTEQAVVDAITKRLSEVGVSKERIHAADGDLPFKNCTALINAPSIKVHTLVGFASSIKNYINLSDKASSYHGDGNLKLGEVWLMPDIKGKTRLIVVDALRPYFGPGPQINPLHRWDYKGILVSTDPVALDTVCLKMCDIKRKLYKGEEWPITPPPRFLAAADTEYHLGTNDPSKIQVMRLGWDKDILI
jgi:hypothetical protein